MHKSPRITLVTPSFNQGHYIESTIDSVLSQGYNNLQYIVVDGGSTDGSKQILRRYEKHFDRLIIEPDSGSAEAINKGLALADGEWFNWLNSDDLLMPGALNQLAEHAYRWPNKKWISGSKVNIDSDGRFVNAEAPWREDANFWLLGEALFPQDATFIKTELLKTNNILLNSKLQNVYDTVLYLELLGYCDPLIVSSVFSAMRWHSDQKTNNAEQRAKETKFIMAATKRIPNYRWVSLMRRLCRTRASRLMKLILVSFAILGICPSRLNWDVDYFSVWDKQFIPGKIRDYIII